MASPFMDTDKRLQELAERVRYAQDILGGKENRKLSAFAQHLDEVAAQAAGTSAETLRDQVAALEQRLAALEENLDLALTPMDKVRIVRHPQHLCLKDILENVYDNYTEIGGRGEVNIDPGMCIARAYLTRRVGNKVMNQPVMVVGQEKGHGEEFRNGGSIKPWGNSKALKYMKVAALENIPIHTFVFTPGSYPIEDFPGAAQQIAENIYEMGGLPVPIVSVICEGGSGGAEAIGVADKRLMLSHGYYSVISPEGAAAIEGRIKPGQRASAELIERCAGAQQITAQDNLKNGYIDGIVQEPPLGARPEHFEFFKRLRAEIIRATDEVALSVRGMRIFRRAALRAGGENGAPDNLFVRWELSSRAKERLLWRRYRKYRRMAQQAFSDNRSILEKMASARIGLLASAHSAIRYDLFRKVKKKVAEWTEDVTDEIQVVTGKLGQFRKSTLERLGVTGRDDLDAAAAQLTSLSEPAACDPGQENCVRYLSPKAREDREISCPHASKRGCLDIWARDLYAEFAGVCPNCGHHFTMEYQWYLANVFDPDSIREFNKNIAAGNPTGFPGFDERLAEAKSKTGLQSSCMTFSAAIHGIQLTCAMLVANFRGGSVGAAEGEKFIRALALARKRHQPFLAYVHGTAGIRIQEGLNGLIQMPRCTLAVRRYIEAGGLYIVLYDTNSYAGPVASFLGCSPYQFAVRSARIGFAGPGVIKETTGLDIPPNYHSAHSALSRGHIQDIWDRREIRRNLQQVFLTMGGRNLYYR
jgi:acetyl-CoA carboxylase carboxyl transferase subunit beta